MKEPRTNSVILASIPLKRKLKRYWVSKYERIAANCGEEEACRKFKNLRNQILRYRADSNRKANLETYLKSTGFRNNGRLRMLFEYADSQPQYVLNFLKIYSAAKGSGSEQIIIAKKSKKRLDAVRSNPAVPHFLEDWILQLEEYPPRGYEDARRNAKHAFHKLAQHQTLQGWCDYWGKWRGIFLKDWLSPPYSGDTKLVFPEVYKDFQVEDDSSESYAEDVRNLMAGKDIFPPLLDEELYKFVLSFLDIATIHRLERIWSKMGTDEWFEYFGRSVDLNMGDYVGHVHHIPKKGSGTELRDIAVPNRFFQMALVPCADSLYHLLRRFPKDCTFDQDRFDQRIQNRVNNENLYVGSVDLSKATDNLPFNWGRFIVDHFVWKRHLPLAAQILRDPPQMDFYRSWKLFNNLVHSKWEDQGVLMCWHVGQPLGSLPSFALLGITHNVFVESLAASMGYAHSPYYILGDDIVLTNKRLRRRYIQEMNSRGIPLSLHKSYEGNLTEFAGKIYIKNCIPFYCSDHSPITWESLFDYQRSTGIRIPWSNIPRRYRKRIISITKDQCYPKNSVQEWAKSSYETVQKAEILGRGAHLYPLVDSENVLPEYYYLRERSSEERLAPEARKHTGLTLLGSHLVTLMSPRFTDHNGYFLRYEPVRLPEWYRKKFRPVTTDVAITCASRALRDTQVPS